MARAPPGSRRQSQAERSRQPRLPQGLLGGNRAVSEAGRIGQEKGCATRVTRIQVLGNGSCQWRVLDRLVEGGKTVVVIEHNPDVIKTADWVIDLGPEGGDGGGRIVAEGTPERVAATGASFTGRFLAPLLPKAPLRRAARQAQARASDTREGRAGLA